MEVVSLSSFRTGSVLWRPRPDRWTLTVVCKATYALAPGESALAADQEAVRERDGFWDDDPRRSVYAPSDLAPFKPRADVILVGHAYAPRSEVVRSLTARLMVGEMEKAVEVFCPRVLSREGDLREGARWSKAPLRYEYAAGGLSTWNPVGVGPSAPADVYGQRPLPNLQPPGLRVAQWGDIFVPTGMGPLSPTWLLRRGKLGRHAEGWSDDGWTQIPLDDDFDGEFFQTAPPDQQIDGIRDDERLVLEYLNPDHPSLTTKLAGVHPHAFVEIPGAVPRDLVMTADTLWIDTDRALCTLTWRGQVAVDGPAQQGRVLVALEEAGQHLTWSDVSGDSSVESIPSEAPQPPRTPKQTLPFIPTEPQPPPAPPVIHDDDADAPHTPRKPSPRKTLEMFAAPLPPPTPPPPAALPLPPPLPPPDRVTPLVIERAIEVVWCSPSLPARARRSPGWSPAAPEGGAIPPEREAARMLARATPVAVGLERALFASIGEDGALAPALVVLAGEISFVFDETEALRAVIPLARPSARGDARLAGLLDMAEEIARAEPPGFPDVAGDLSARIRDAWAQAKPMLPAGQLGLQVERALVARRAYQRRELLGKKWIRALFRTAGEAEPVPAYVPAAVGPRLPLFRSFPARIVAELRPQQEPYAASPVMLAVLALGREIARGG